MKKIAILAIGGLLLFGMSGCAQTGGGDEVISEKNPRARYLSASELAHAISELATLEYPATQTSVNARLGIVDRGLLVFGSLVPGMKGPGGMDDYLTYNLTDPDDAHRQYNLYVWIERAAEKLSGPPFANGRVVGYAEIVLIDHDLHAQFLAQSDRYPHGDVSYASRRLVGPEGATSGHPTYAP